MKLIYRLRIIAPSLISAFLIGTILELLLFTSVLPKTSFASSTKSQMTIRCNVVKSHAVSFSNSSTNFNIISTSGEDIVSKTILPNLLCPTGTKLSISYEFEINHDELLLQGNELHAYCPPSGKVHIKPSDDARKKMVCVEVWSETHACKNCKKNESLYCKYDKSVEEKINELGKNPHLILEVKY